MRTLRPLSSPAISARALNARVVALDLFLVASLCVCLSLAGASLGPWSIDFFLAVLLFWGTLCGAVLAAWASETDTRSFGLANRVTLFRGLLIGVPAGAVLVPHLPLSAAWIIAGVAAIAALLDALDGWLARHLHECSRFGERFDLEVDAVLVMVLSALAWQIDKVGAWVLLSGLLRYLFLFAGALMPWLQSTLPTSRRRQVICALQTATLVIVVMPATPTWLATPLAAFGLLSLTSSFIMDVHWLKQQSNMGESRC